MNPVDPHAYLQQVALRMKDLQDRSEIETVLDEVEYLFEILDPSLQDGAEALIAQLRAKLAKSG
ncbi:MAG: hypothetical protein Q8J99_11010 [Sulfuritalea sp.]|nr:hypothetical protein [Sulfuritalea sp.]